MSAGNDNSPAAALAQAVMKLAKSPMVAMSGHGGALKLLLDYLADQQRRIAGLEAEVCELKRRGR